MKGILAAVFIIYGLSFSSILGQSYCDVKHDYIWIMGDLDTDTVTTDKYGGCEIDFNTFPLSLNLHPRNVANPFQNASMSSLDGELIFYSNGCVVLNAMDSIMDNGDTLNPGEVYVEKCPYYGYVGFQNMISIPDSYNESLYHLFHMDLAFNREPGAPFLLRQEHLYSTTIDMSFNGGLGKVIEKNKVILADTGMLGSPVTAVKHANGMDWWIITPDRWTNGFHIFELTSSQITYVGMQELGVSTKPEATGGQAKFSPQGDRFAWYHPKNNLFLYDFDRTTGLLSNFRLIEIPFGDYITGGCEFSPSGQFLYVNHNTSLFQLDMLAENIQESLVHIADFDGFGDPFPTVFFTMERTPDKRIIMNVLNGSRHLHVIQEPDKKGIACRFEQHSIKLPTVNNFTLPHFPNYRLGPLGEPLCDSLMVNTEVHQESHEFKVVPNPAFDFIRIMVPDHLFEKDFIYSIYDLNGMLLITTSDKEIEIERLLPGMYMVRIEESNQVLAYSRFIVTSHN